MIGSIAGILTTFAFVPQVIKIVKTQKYRSHFLTNLSVTGDRGLPMDDPWNHSV